MHVVNCLFFVPVTEESVIQRFLARFDEKFFQYSDKELTKINTFFSGKWHLLFLI